jgi:hypothetical protein
MHEPSKYLKGQLQAQHSVDTVNYIADKWKHKNGHKASVLQ